MKTLFVQLFLCCAALAAHHILLAQARKYNTHGKIDDNKINVHIVPHSHDDAGWQMSVDEYYFERVNDIYDSVVSSLSENKDRHFIVVETSFFAMWFREQPKEKRAIAKRLIESGQLEFINAAWCMHDEAAPLYREMVDQTTRGHQWIIKNINSTLTPKGAWQIDPFGHSNTQAWLLSAEAGMPSLFFARMDYQDRIPKIKSKDLEWVWEGSKSLGSKAKVFAGQLFGQGVDWLGYSSWVQFDDTFAEFRNYVQDDKYLHDYNVEEWVEKIIRFAKQEAAAYKTNHQMWTVGGDFAFQVARRYYRNLDKLIHYVNKNGTVNMLYSTPTKYLDAKYRSVMNKTTLAVVSQPASPVNDVGTTSLVEEVFQFTFDKRHEDIFPLGDAPHQYWTGYFSSRLAVKKLVRNSGSWLNIARQVEAWMPVSKYQVGVLDDTEFESDDDAIDEEKDNKIPTEHQDQNQNKLPAKSHGSIPVGSGWTDELEGAVSVVMHHDGISGTSRQSTTNDYIQRLSEGAVIAENGIAVAYNKYVFKSDTKDSTSKQDSEPSTATAGIDHCNCHTGGPMNCLNISTCAFTSDKNTFTVVIWNPTEARSVKKGTGYLLDIPVNGNVAVEEEEFSGSPEESKDSAAKAVWKVFDIGRGIDVQTQLINVDHITANLAKLHLNKFGLTSNEITFELSKTLNNPATHRLLAFVDLAGFGYSTFRISKGSAKETQPSKKVEEKTTAIQATEDDNGKEVKPERREEIKEEHVIPNSKVEPDVSYSHMISTKERLLRGDDNNDSNLKKDSQVAGKYPIRISNEYFEIEFDADTNHMKKITNLVSNVEIDIDVEWGWYKASEGGCSPMSVQMPSEIRCSMQASGAYIFRPYDNVLHYPHDDFSFSDSKEALEALADIKKKLKTEVVEGPVVSEVRQTYSSWASHVVRLVQGKPAIEIEWTAGPIPIENHWLLGEEELNGAKEKNWGKELIIKYKTSLKNKGEFYTDANGREMQKRIVNKRGPSFPKMLEFRDEPISSNYYPVNTIIAIDDESKNIEMAVLTDMTQGGSSIRDGEIELMVGRRLLIDDWRGVEEPLNETMCGCGDINARPGRMGEHGHLGDGGCECSGLAVRGRHWLIVDKIEEVHKQRRKLVEDMNNQPMISFTTKTPDVDVALKSFVNDNEIPENIRLITFTTNYDPILFGKEALKWDQQKTKQVLIRFSHLYEVGEHSELSKPSTFSLAKVFSKVGAGFVVDQFKEVSLTGNQPIEEMDKFASKYNWPLKSGDSNEEDSSGSSTDGNNKRSRLNGSDPQGIVTINPMEVRTFVARITYE